ETATVAPNPCRAPSSLGVSLAPCCAQVEPARVKTHAAPAESLSAGVPITAVLPSPDSPALKPKNAAPASSLGVSFGPCCVQVEPDRVNTHAAPAASLSVRPVTSAALPSADSAT